MQQMTSQRDDALKYGTTTDRLSFCSFMSPTTTYEEDVALASAHGFAGLDVCESKLKDVRKDGTRTELLAEHGLRATACVPVAISPLPGPRTGPFLQSDDLDELRSGMLTSVERLAGFGASSVVLVTGSTGGVDWRSQRDIAVEGIREAARVAARVGTTISLEVVRWEESSLVHTLPDALDLIEAVGESNVDLAYDVFHVWDTPDIETLTEAHAGSIGTVHVCDWLEGSADHRDRGFAGEGVAGVSRLVAALERGGFTGWYDVEVFHRQFSAMSPEDLFRKSRETWDQTWAEATQLI